MDKGELRNRLDGYAYELTRNIEEVMFLLKITSRLMQDSADLCRHIGTLGFDVDTMAADGKILETYDNATHAISHAYYDIKNAEPAISEYVKYLKYCGIPMSPADPDFFKFFNFENLRIE